jgi:hypothetical protein
LNVLFASFNFDKIEIRSKVFIRSYFKCKQLQEDPAVAWILKTKEKKSAKIRKLGFLRNDCVMCIWWGRKQKTEKKPGRNPR